MSRRVATDVAISWYFIGYVPRHTTFSSWFYCDNNTSIFEEVLMKFSRMSLVVIHCHYTIVMYRYCTTGNSTKPMFDSHKGTFLSCHTPGKLRYRTVPVLYRTDALLRLNTQ
jgi:hypothetical protein